MLLPFLLKRLGVKMTLAVDGQGGLGAALCLLRFRRLRRSVLVVAGRSASARHLLRLLLRRRTDLHPPVRRRPVRSSTQGLITLATYGVGILIGSLVSGPIVDYFATADAHLWRQIWIIPAVIAAVVLVLFLLLFKDRSTTATASLGLESEVTTLEAPGAPLPMPRDRDVDR